MAATATRPARRHRIRVWFGEHMIADHTADEPYAERYAAAVARRFAGLKITDDLVPLQPHAEAGRRMTAGPDATTTGAGISSRRTRGGRSRFLSVGLRCHRCPRGAAR